MSLVDIKNVSLGYENDVVINNISFDINKRDFILVIGSNGVGKSTLIKGILGIIKPLSGKVDYREIDRKFIGYMPQDLKIDQNFPATVFEIVLSGRINQMGRRPFYNKEDKEKAIRNLQILGIEDLKNKSFNELSGGQRQKVLLARCLCATSSLIVLDEPSNNLDQESKVEFYSTLIHLNEGHGISILMITHDVDRDRDSLIGNKVLELKKNGYFFGTTEDYLKENGYDS